MISIGDHFDGFAIKRLVNVDVNKAASNQHEFNGSTSLIGLLGRPSHKQYLPTQLAYLDDDVEELPPLLDSTLTWYDARARHPTRSELHLYYPAAAEPVIYQATEGDVLFLLKRRNNQYLLLIAAQDSSILRQLQWLFAVQEPTNILDVEVGLDKKPQRAEIAGEELLTWLGINTIQNDSDFQTLIQDKFPGPKWPSTQEFSAFARSLVSDSSPIEDPDGTLLRWVNMEHRLFRTLEKLRVGQEISTGFLDQSGNVDVDAFTSTASSILNRRKSRAGLSLEEHLGEVLRSHNVMFAKKAKTEGKKEPDFLFPSKATYDDLNFPSAYLTMLGSKTTLKDRWRQVLNEANRIPKKHLFTLQPGISQDQTSEMQSENLQLVVPRELHQEGFTNSQRAWLMDLQEFITEVKDRKNAAFDQYPRFDLVAGPSIS
ncbi:type II restriction endonuclease [Glutamicibacter mishrai]|uniref:type II restriction endonuclease n=1 Tax=Glutamicibacter mishrai TaxID=1775880 RepID=UPI0020CCB893|nr:type II restriction endonuclease [Glutamicibacter mishrai]UTT39446.1 type II restriction endonuclease [Glutamicibacter mishrai]